MFNGALRRTIKMIIIICIVNRIQDFVIVSRDDYNLDEDANLGFFKMIIMKS